MTIKWITVGRIINKVRFADDMAIIAKTQEKLYGYYLHLSDDYITRL